MPDPKLTDALDLQRLHEIAEMADLAGNLWHALRLAAERGDSEIVRHHVKQIIVLTRSTAAAVKHLGSSEVDDARQ